MSQRLNEKELDAVIDILKDVVNVHKTLFDDLRPMQEENPNHQMFLLQKEKVEFYQTIIQKLNQQHRKVN
ncbi:hypothetical protein MKX67_04900 [Cytobacillus sp. FSL W7-1323]|uniref:Spore coat protein n=1 Tax=Cytobacillus kochii TaxID=859143 RepID=A0A248TF46_9BACI|nr:MULTISPECIES: hypothetical protein [Cytobacillus]ASV66815.1 hypothetical protein CKF48_05465 [Cytobacillus kochii]MCA1024628.1 hypothetical protein [Cytobacillus kochii]MCM3323378.1 hypothetical protein [Cytobacillus kochii]MCM3345773.1 hypothetical protein [Cytobacillus kochii]MDM5206314.1 hypothetical protein [Cytobacillus kochii]